LRRFHLVGELRRARPEGSLFMRATSKGGRSTRAWGGAAALLVTAACSTAAGESVKAERVRAAAVDRLFAKVDKPDTPGCALAVIREGRIVYERGYGLADLDHDVRITPATPFHVASVSKQFTAAAILLLAQDGKLSLDDDVRKHLPELPDFGVPITLRHLVHHTSGLRDQWDLLGLAGWRYSLDLITDDDVLEVVTRQKELNFRPGEEYLYCNTGYTLLGQVVKRVSGQSLREFTSARIFGPLGMKSTHFRDDHAEIIKGQAYAYAPAKASFRLSITNFDTVGATSLFTTVEDLVRWDRNFDDPRVGGPSFVRQMLQKGRLNDGRELDYAFGLSVREYRGLPIVEHAGGDAGYRSHLMRFPDQRFAVACLCNAASLVGPSQVARRIADLYLKTELRPQPESSAGASTTGVTLPPERLVEKAGTYWNPKTDQIHRLGFDDGKLFVVNQEERIPLLPLSEGRFSIVDFGVDLQFEPAEGEPARLLVTAGAPPEPFERLPAFVPPAEGGEHAGRYRSDEIDPVYRLAVRDSKLVLLRSKREPETLEPVRKDLFVAPLGTVQFRRDARGGISEMLVSTGRVRRLRFKKESPSPP
jgi:CubicO group peptidase (beta-lactamase class C family)